MAQQKSPGKSQPAKAAPKPVGKQAPKAAPKKK